MKVFVITGTSGVGKSHLENELEKNYWFHRMKTYTDRERRVEEQNDPGRICISREEYQQMKPDFIFELEYTGNHYGWRRDEFKKYRNTKNIVFVVTLEAMVRMVKAIRGAIPVLLNISKENFGLIESRMKKRMGYKQIKDKEKLKEIDDKISKRLELAETEVNKIGKYKKVLNSVGGMEFEITDDKVLYEQIIPAIIKRSKEK